MTDKLSDHRVHSMTVIYRSSLRRTRVSDFELKNSGLSAHWQGAAVHQVFMITVSLNRFRITNISTKTGSVNKAVMVKNFA